MSHGQRHRPHTHAERRRGVAAHGPRDQPDGDQLAAAVRRARRLAAGEGDHRSATGEPLSPVPAAGGRVRRSSRGRVLGGRPALRPRPAPPPPRATGTGRPLGAAGARGRSDGRAARPRQGALARLHGRRLRRGLRHVRAHAPLHSRRHRSVPRDAVADRLGARRRDRGRGFRGRAARRWPAFARTQRAERGRGPGPRGLRGARAPARRAEPGRERGRDGRPRASPRAAGRRRRGHRAQGRSRRRPPGCGPSPRAPRRRWRPPASP